MWQGAQPPAELNQYSPSKKKEPFLAQRYGVGSVIFLGEDYR